MLKMDSFLGISTKFFFFLGGGGGFGSLTICRFRVSCIYC